MFLLVKHSGGPDFNRVCVKHVTVLKQLSVNVF